MAENKTIVSLLGRGFGGAGAVISPGSRDLDNLPDSLPPAGVDEAISELVSSTLPGSKANNLLVFLIGGPGNGKSHQLVRLMEQLDLKSNTAEASSVAARSESYDLGDSELLLLNDATIRTKKPEGVGQLCEDIRAALSSTTRTRKSSLFCANRGVLVEEAASSTGDPAWFRENQIVNWLLNRSGLENRVIQHIDSSDYLRSCLVQSDNDQDNPVKVLAVYLDQLSLLESQPTHGSPYRVAPLGHDSRLESPFSVLLERVIEQSRFEQGECGACEASELCPFLSNVISLRNDNVRKGVLDIARSAEITTGQLFTYRDAWTLIANLVIGFSASGCNYDKPCTWVRKQVQAGSGKDLVALFSHRLFNSLFADDIGASTIADTKALSNLRAVDPARDALPTWAGPVNDAIQAIKFTEEPLEHLTSQSQKVNELCCTLDQIAFAELSKPIIVDSQEATESDFRVQLDRLGKAFFRMYGLVHGIAANSEIVTEWLGLRSISTGERKPLGTGLQLSSAIKSLLLPPSEFDEFKNLTFLPLYEPRVVPVIGPSDRKTWCHGVETYAQVNWHCWAHGDSLWLTLTEISSGETISEFQLDFDLCREAMASVIKGSQAGAFGFTDQVLSVGPRIERIRAALLSNGLKNDPNTLFVTQADVNQVIVSLD